LVFNTQLTSIKKKKKEEKKKEGYRLKKMLGVYILFHSYTLIPFLSISSVVLLCLGLH